MRKINFFLLVGIFGLASAANGKTFWPRPSYYHYQLGATFGVNRISVGAADGPGSHWGVYTRVDRHTFGFKQEWDGEFVKLWGEPLYYRRTGIYYGWSHAGQYLQWGPQISIGRIEYNHPTYGNEPPRPIEEGMFGEIAVHGLINLRGSGVGCRVFLNINRFVPILGATIYLQTGWAWNPKSGTTQAKMGSSPTLPEF